MTSYPIVEDGEWIQPIRRGYRMKCCDCGLVHVFNFRIIKYARGKRVAIQFQATRVKRRKRRKK